MALVGGAFNIITATSSDKVVRSDGATLSTVLIKAGLGNGSLVTLHITYMLCSEAGVTDMSAGH